MWKLGWIKFNQLKNFNSKKSMHPLLKNFFYPQYICVIGASSKEKSIGFEILKSIKENSKQYNYEVIVLDYRAGFNKKLNDGVKKATGN